MPEDTVLRAPTPEDFGFGHIKIKKKLALGSRNLLVILAKYPETPPIKPNPWELRKEEYDRLVFGPGFPNVRDFFSQASGNQFTWRRPSFGVIGPIDVPFVADDASRYAAVLQRASQLFDFSVFDVDGDSEITSEELGVLIFESPTEYGGATRVVDVKIPQGKRLWVRASAVGHRINFKTIIHELGHQLQSPGVEMYGGLGGIEDLNYGCTVMGSTIVRARGDLTSVAFDPWHRLQLGWMKPVIKSMRAPGEVTLNVPGSGSPDGLILYDPARGTNEYLLIEYRPRTGLGAEYDHDACDSGVAVWHVMQGLDKGKLASFVQTFGVQGRKFWRSEDTVPFIRWASISGGAVVNDLFAEGRIHMRRFSAADRQVTVEWMSDRALAVAPRSGDRFDLIGLDKLDGLVWKSWSGTEWSPSVRGWTPLNGTLRAAPCIVAADGDRIHLIGMGADHKPYYKTWTGGSRDDSAGGWVLLGERLSTAVAATASVGRVDLFALGEKGQLLHKRLADGIWSPSQLVWNDLGYSLTATPAAVATGSDEVEVFVRGTDFRYYRRKISGTTLDAMNNASEDHTFTTGPVAAGGGGTVHLAGIGGDGAVYNKRISGSEKTDWLSLGGTFVSAPALLVDGQRVEIFALGTDYGVYHITWNGTNWSAWQPLGGKFASPITVSSREPGSIDLFGVKTDGQTYHRRFRGGAWSSWIPLGGTFAY